MGRSIKQAIGLALATACSIAGCYSAGDDDDVASNGGGAGGSAGAASPGGKGGTSGGQPGRGGSVSSGGSAGVAGAAGTAGSGGSAGGLGTADLGRDCITDAECGQGLICVARDDVATLGGAPPGGLCTAACATDNDCLTISANGWCIPFTSDASGGYCLEGCAMDAGLNPKCHNRIDMVCSGIQFEPLATACLDNIDCGVNEACVSGECNLVLTVCLPSCGSDADCDAGLFCDYRTGLCGEAPPTGKGFNEPCDPNAVVDECTSGYCSASYEVPTTGTCSGFCNLGNPFSCGYEGDGKADAACLFSTV
ncbi:MAG TPA: hypothetical protein VM686_24925, partial [Polyangiaceae bacterium]|nr:hypothetical protein [Polyangiaceae bacterium]